MNRWRLAPGVRRVDDVTLVGGRPYRLIRLTNKGAMALTVLLTATAPTPNGSAEARLAARLVRAGMLVPPLPAPVAPGDVTVVIPAHSAPGPVRRLLDAIPDEVPVVIVDDASPLPLDRLAEGSATVTVVRHHQRRGAAVARNTGAALCDTRWILFADADVEPRAGWIGALLAVAEAPGVVACAPRIVNLPSAGLAGLVETHANALDMGTVPVDVGPESVVSFVPTAALLVDRTAFSALGGFDPAMPVGEDVDLVWRLARTGRVRYEPRVTVAHRPRATLGRALARRSFYGESVALLETRHPGVIRHADVPLDALVPWLLGIFVHPAAGVAAAGLAVLRAPRGSPLPPDLARRLAATRQVTATVGLGRWLVRPMLPLAAAAVAVASPVVRRRLAGAVALGYLDIAVRAGLDRRRAGATARDVARTAAGAVAARALDDLGYGFGAWRGCLRARTAWPLWLRVRRATPTGRGSR